MATYQNRRVFYATQALGFAPMGSTTYIATHGAQTVGVNTNFTLEDIQEIGQISVYQLVEQIPEIEVNCEKVLDGYPPLICLATQQSPTASLVSRAAQRAMFAVSIYGDVQNSASGTPLSQVQVSGLYFQSSNYNFGTDQSLRESITLVGNNITWLSGGYTFTPTFTNLDSPFALAGSGGVQIRRDVIFYPILATGDPNSAREKSGTTDANGMLTAFLTILPREIEGISNSGTNDRDSTGQFTAHINGLTCGVNMNRDLILELGRKEPYFRFAQFPTQVNSSVTVISKIGNLINANELGLDGFGNNLNNQTMRIRVREGTFIDLGIKNKLQSATYGGGDTTGGQVTCTYSYLNYNDYTVTHPQDPSNANMGLGGGVVWPY